MEAKNLRPAEVVKAFDAAREKQPAPVSIYKIGQRVRFRFHIGNYKGQHGIVAARINHIPDMDYIVVWDDGLMCPAKEDWLQPPRYQSWGKVGGGR